MIIDFRLLMVDIIFLSQYVEQLLIFTLSNLIHVILFVINQRLDNNNFGNFINLPNLTILQKHKPFIPGLLNFAIAKLAPDSIALNNSSNKRITVSSKFND